MTLGEIFEDAVLSRFECGRRAVDRIEHDDYIGGVIHRLAIDGMKCCELARLMIVEEGEVSGVKIGDGFAGVVSDLYVKCDAPGGHVLAIALLFGSCLERGILSGCDESGQDKE